MVHYGYSHFIRIDRNGLEIVLSLYPSLLQLIVKWFNIGLFLPTDGFSSRLLQFISYTSRVGTATAQLVNFSVFGFSDTTDLVSYCKPTRKTIRFNGDVSFKSMVHVLVGHYPAGGSARTVSQFFENYNSGNYYY